MRAFRRKVGRRPSKFKRQLRTRYVANSPQNIRGCGGLIDSCCNTLGTADSRSTPLGRYLAFAAAAVVTVAECARRTNACLTMPLGTVCSTLFAAAETCRSLCGETCAAHCCMELQKQYERRTMSSHFAPAFSLLTLSEGAMLSFGRKCEEADPRNPLGQRTRGQHHNRESRTEIRSLHSNPSNNCVHIRGG